MAADRPVIYLHIGAMKTGTTHLQELLTANADALRSSGYLFPLTRGRYSQTLAARDVLNMSGDAVTLEKARGEWGRTSELMMNFEGEASVFSMEFLSFARRRAAGRIVKSLEGAEVHGILTVRDAASAIPAQWQQAMQSQRTTSWNDFVEQIMADPPDYDSWGAKTFRRAQDIPRMLRAWLPHIPPERFTVVTLPRPGSPRSLLWERFASTIGIDPQTASKPAPKSNESIGAASAELMRRVNEQLDDIRISDYRGTMRHTLSIKILSDRASTEGKAPTNAAFRAFAAGVNERTRAAIESSGVRVVGDLDDLPTDVESARTGEGDALPSPDESEVVAAAAYALPRMRDVVSSRAKALRRTGEKISARKVLADLPEAPDEPAVIARWNASSDATETAVADLTATCRTAIDLGCRLRDASGGSESGGRRFRWK
ncbi:MAG: hypothetical protein ACRDO7_05370 [Nocardioidaceae bacterium]